jgi:ABC-type multidrug transport system fused ATPase/permease subunit
MIEHEDSSDSDSEVTEQSATPHQESPLHLIFNNNNDPECSYNSQVSDLASFEPEDRNKKPVSVWQCSYTDEIRQESKKLIIDSMAVFIAISLSVFVNSIIIHACQHSSVYLSAYSIKLEVIISFIYALSVYLLGKLLFLFFGLCPEARLPTFLNKTKNMIFFKHFLIEHSAFTWKEFSTVLFFTYLYETERSEVGQYLTLSIFLWSLFCLVFLFLSHLITHNFLSQYLDHHLKYELYEFDYYCFSLSIAYMITVAWALWFKGHSILLAKNDQFLFGWQTHSLTYCHNDTHSSSHATGGFSGDDYYYSSSSHAEIVFLEETDSSSVSFFPTSDFSSSSYSSSSSFIDLFSSNTTTDDSAGHQTHQYREVLYSFGFILYPICVFLTISITFLMERVLKNVYKRWKDYKLKLKEEQEMKDIMEEFRRENQRQHQEQQQQQNNIRDEEQTTENPIISKRPFTFNISTTSKDGDRSYSKDSANSYPSIDFPEQQKSEKENRKSKPEQEEIKPFISIRGFVYSLLEFWLTFKG